MAISQLNWDLEKLTAYWAGRVSLPIAADQPLAQYDGSDLFLSQGTWIKYTMNKSFPAYCQYLRLKGYLLASPSNIIRCYQDGLFLQALALTVAWGRMWRVKWRIYTRSLNDMDLILRDCVPLIEDVSSVDYAWRHLRQRLHWTPVMTSKYLHFLVRSLGCEDNPPVPLDNAVILQKVWPAFQNEILKVRQMADPPLCRQWRSYGDPWEGYSRYMTAITCWANQKGWSTTQFENTAFREYRQAKDGCKSLQITGVCIESK